MVDTAAGESSDMKLPVMPPVAPMLAKPAAAIPPGQFYEPKWDGFRAIVFRDGDEVEIGSRKERPMTRYFPEVVEAVRRSFPPRAVIDGEIVIAGDGGLDFSALQQRIHPAASRVDAARREDPGELRRVRPARARRRRPHGRAVRGAPRRARAGAAGRRAAGPPDPDHARRGRRARWFERFEGAGLDGLIAKRAELTYQPDKRVMTKIKHVRTADCVVAGYRVHKPSADAIGSLLLGLYVDAAAPPSPWMDRTNGLAPVGVIGAFPMARRRELFAELQPLVVDFATTPGAGRASWAARPRAAAAGTRRRTCRSCRCGRSGSSRCATTTWRARASAIRRSSCAGAPTATRPRAATPSSSSRRRSTSPTSSPGD